MKCSLKYNLWTPLCIIVVVVQSTPFFQEVVYKGKAFFKYNNSIYFYTFFYERYKKRYKDDL